MPNLYKGLFTPILFLAAMLQINTVYALGLLEAYEAALQNDSEFRAAYYENEAGKQAENIGRAGLLPNLSITHSQGRSAGSQKFQGTSSKLDFETMVSSLSLRQPLINMEAVASYQQGKHDANSSRAKFTGQSQQLFVRLVESYVKTLLAKDHLKLAEAKLNALNELMYVNEHMLKKGEGTTTDVLETKSKFALAQAEEIEARDELDVAELELTAIIGKRITQLDPLSDTFNVQAIPLPDYDSWQTLALKRNAELVTQRHMVQSSKEEINKSRAGHAPSLDLVASISKNKSASFFTQGRDAELASIGIEVNFPLFAGGRVVAVTDQAQANYERTRAELDNTTERVLVELHKQYKLILSSARRIESIELGVEAANLLIQATQKSIQGGVRINLDLLNAQEQLFTAKRDLAEVRYNYLLAYLRLQLTAGTLALEDLRVVASYFAPNN